jgi:hypothetical protein
MFDLFAGHEVVRELKAMSAWLDHHREPASLVAADLRRDGEGDGAGLPGAQAGLRLVQAAPLAELSGADVPSGRLAIVPGVRPAAARLDPQKSVLHQTISSIRAQLSIPQDPTRSLQQYCGLIKIARARLAYLRQAAGWPRRPIVDNAARGPQGPATAPCSRFRSPLALVDVAIHELLGGEAARCARRGATAARRGTSGAARPYVRPLS